MILQACLSTVKVCERIFTIVEVSEARVGQDSKHCFNQCGGLPMLVKACLSTVKVSKQRFTHR